MKSIVAILGFALTFFVNQAYSYSADGHQTVGAIADELLQSKHSASYKKIITLLGTVDGKNITLKDASVWPDCARSYYRGTDGKIHKNEHDRFESDACAVFDGPEGEATLKDYVAANYSNCNYAGNNTDCHKSYHFADIPIEATQYQDGSIGTSDHDIVHAINACISVLSGKQAPAPFHLNQRQALFLLTHLVGDLHQPLHVGSVYLDASGKRVNPTSESDAKKESTTGGNSLAITDHENLHHKWDATSFLKDNKLPLLVAQAGQFKDGNTAVQIRASVWATETLQEAKLAFLGVSYSASTDNEKWTVRLLNPNEYNKNVREIQEHAVVRAGARLADLLATIFP